MRTLKNYEILQTDIERHVRRLVLRLIVAAVIITAWDVFIHSGAFNALVVHCSNVIVGGWK